MSEALREFNRIKYTGVGSTENTGHSCLDGWVEIIFPDPPSSESTFVSASDGNVLTTHSQDFYDVDTGVLSAGTYYIEMVNEHILYNEYDVNGYTHVNWGWTQGEQLMGDMKRHTGNNPDGWLLSTHMREEDTDLRNLLFESCNPTVIPQLRKFDSDTVLQFAAYTDYNMNMISRIFILKTSPARWRRPYVEPITEDFSELHYNPLRRSFRSRTPYMTYKKDYTSYGSGLIEDPYDLNQYRTVSYPDTNYGMVSHPTVEQSDVGSVESGNRFALGQYNHVGMENVVSTAGMNGYYRYYGSCAPVTELNSAVLGNIYTDPRANYCMARMMEVTGNVGRGEDLDFPQRVPTINSAGNTVHSNAGFIRLSATEPIAADNRGNPLNTFKSLDYRTRFREDAKFYIYDMSYYGSWDTEEWGLRHNKNTFTTGTTLPNSDLIPTLAGEWTWFPENIGCMMVLVTIAVDFGLSDVEVRYGSGSDRDQTRIVNASHPTAIFQMNWNNVNRGVIRLRFLRRTGNSSGESFEYVNITRVVLNSVSTPHWG